MIEFLAAYFYYFKQYAFDFDYKMIQLYQNKESKDLNNRALKRPNENKFINKHMFNRF